jgi:hypothetical protein
MQNGLNSTDSSPPATFPDPQDGRIIFLLCCLAAVHVFVFSAAVPFFSNVDEQIHFDLAVKYSQGHIPRKLETLSDETLFYPVVFGSHEFLWPSNDFPSEKFPPPWTQPVEKAASGLLVTEAQWKAITNYEASQPPLYYALAAAWWRLGKVCGFQNGHLLYWLRFLNLLVAAALVWVGFVAARLVFPESRFLQLGVPALLAFLPQSAFYSIQNDVLSPLCFGAAFICLVRLWEAEIPGARLGAAAGLALAAVFLTKISNLPLLAVSGVVVLLKIRHLAKAGKMRAAGPALAALALCVGLPAIAWLAWCKYNFGDFTGTVAKVQHLRWTYKPFSEWWHHPIFTPRGLWTFLSGLLATLWQGEILWHRRPLALPMVDAIYALSSILLVGTAVTALLFHSAVVAARQRLALWFSFWSFIAAVGFLGFLSIIYDFHDCFYPSRDHPYFTSGRLMLGALIPFLLLYLYGLDRMLFRVRNRWVRPLVLVGMISFMLISETIIDSRLFPNAYNWFHM